MQNFLALGVRINVLTLCFHYCENRFHRFEFINLSLEILTNRVQYDDVIKIYVKGPRGTGVMLWQVGQKFGEGHVHWAAVVLGPVYTIPFSYEDGTEMFRFGLPSTLYRFPIRHQMKTVAYENT